MTRQPFTITYDAACNLASDSTKAHRGAPSTLEYNVTRHPALCTLHPGVQYDTTRHAPLCLKSPQNSAPPLTITWCILLACRPPQHTLPCGPSRGQIVPGARAFACVTQTKTFCRNIVSRLPNAHFSPILYDPDRRCTPSTTALQPPTITHYCHPLTRSRLRLDVRVVSTSLLALFDFDS